MLEKIVDLQMQDKNLKCSVNSGWNDKWQKALVFVWIQLVTSLSLSLLIMKVYKNVKLQSGFKAAD